MRAKWISESVYIDQEDLVNYLTQKIILAETAAKISDYFEEEYFDSYILYKDLVVITELNLFPDLTNEQAESVINDLLDDLITMSEDAVVLIDAKVFESNKKPLFKALYSHYFNRINDLFFY